LNLQTRELPEHNPALKLQVAFILDELAAAGRIPILAQGVAYLPGYNVRLMLVIQAFSQLREIYGQQNAETMMKSLAARIVYAPKDIAEATEISNELGFTTVKVRTHSRPVLTVADFKGQRHRSVSVSEQRRPLLLPQEVKELGKNKEILFYEGVRPILARKNRYYRDPLFRKRLFPPPKSAVPHRQPAKRPVALQRPPTPNPATSHANEILEGSVARVEPEKPDSALTEEAMSQTPSPAESTPPTREATLADVDRIESLTLEDFAVDFGGVELPEGPLSETDMSRAVGSFVGAFHGR